MNRLLIALLTAGLLLGAPAVPAMAASRAKAVSGESDAKASRDKKRKALAKTGDQKKKSEKATEAEDKDKEAPDDDLFLAETKENQTWLPDLFRCPECGYEQDESGTCPDHLETTLVLVRVEGKNPLEPPEVDGNEDLIVDMPVTGLVFKKAATASGSASVARPTGSAPAAGSLPGAVGQAASPSPPPRKP